MAEDLASMLCADALVMAKSSLSAWASHAAATRVYCPTKEIADERPDMKVRMPP